MAQGRNNRSTDATEEKGGQSGLHRLEATVKALLEEQNQRMIQACQTNTQNITQNAKSIAALNELIVGLSMQISKIASNEGRSSDSSRTNTNHNGEHETGRRNTYLRGRHQNFTSRMTKVDFPKFDGTDLRSWLYKCNQFFQLDDIEDAQRVRLAAIHLEGKALLWHQKLMKKCQNILPRWAKYTEEINMRFGELYDDPMAELKALKQAGTVQEYHDQFDALASRLTLSEEYMLSCYLGGLEDGTQLAVRMFSPKSVQQALCLAKLHEVSQKAMKSKTTSKPPLLPTPTAKALPAPVTKHNAIVATTTNRRTLTPAEFNEKRANNMCFWCDEKYTPGHKCKGKKSQLYHIEMEDDDECEEETTGHGPEECDQQCAQISVQAMDGVAAFQTMRVTGHHGKRELQLLLDSGSTHNFIDASKALKLDCKVESIDPMWVKVADGGQLKCDKIIKKFNWRMQGVEFTADVYLLPLSGSDLVLGIQWFSSLGPVLWDFVNLTMQFTYKGNKVRLRGAKGKKLKGIQSDKLDKLASTTGELSMIQIIPWEVGYSPQINSVEVETHCRDTGLQTLLQEFTSVFQEPQGLPPNRSNFDHKIPLKEGTDAVNLRPYRYPVLQKNVIEEMVQELMEQGIIRPSNSPFAAPIVLVKKKDGAWRMCVDYRHLNKATIKDKFPIPIIEELLDELQGTKFFSKIDLKSGYHQVRMHPLDVHKTAFKTHFGHFEYLVMPFGLTNAPSTFQSLMNHVFKSLLRKGVLVFFDDILVYSRSWKEHLSHLREVLSLMRSNSLYANLKKCSFGVTEILYLGHIISDKGVQTEQEKIEAVSKWPVPQNVKQLRGFLGLTGYYRRFIQGYGVICRPLTNLLKKDKFVWNEEAEVAFQNLKERMIKPPVLALPNFNKPFLIETDASGEGMGAVLMQEGHPIAFISKAFSSKNSLLSAYERELLAVVFAVQKWQHYLTVHQFIIKTDQHSLKYILDHKLVTSFQQKWLSKLAGFDFVVEYKRGPENKVADALSRVPRSQLLSLTASSVQSDLLRRLHNHWATDDRLKQIIRELQQDAGSHPHYKWQQEQLTRKGKLVVGDNPDIKSLIMNWMHSSPQGGHSGVEVTLRKIQAVFYWSKLRPSVVEFVKNCGVCQKCKADLNAYPGLLQPLPIPDSVWDEVTMDFIEGLPKSNGKEVIMVVIDMLSKYAHFMALSHPFSAVSVAQTYLDHVYKLHGSDRDKVFVSQFWSELMKLQGIQHKLSTAYHPQTDGQSEVLNRCLEGYLRCMCHDNPKDWAKWLSLAEFWYNSNYHSAIQKTLFEVVYGIPPPLHRPYLPNSTKVGILDSSLQ